MTGLRIRALVSPSCAVVCRRSGGWMLPVRFRGGRLWGGAARADERVVSVSPVPIVPWGDEATSEKREARSEKREARSEKREAQTRRSRSSRADTNDVRNHVLQDTKRPRIRNYLDLDLDLDHGRVFVDACHGQRVRGRRRRSLLVRRVCHAGLAHGYGGRAYRQPRR